MMKKYCILILTLFSINTMAQQVVSSRTVSTDQMTKYRQQITKLISQFEHALRTKNTEAFSKLFYNDKIPWVAVFSDEMYQQKRKENPDFPRYVDFGRMGKPSDMIDMSQPQEERMKNINITTDGYLGHVHFNFEDIRSGKVNAHGTEAWSVINTDDGWKITSVTYTVNEE